MSTTNSSRSNPAPNRGPAAVKTTTALVASSTVQSVQLPITLTARGRRRTSTTGAARGSTPRVELAPRPSAPEPSPPSSDNLSETSSTPSAASGGASSRITPHSSTRRSHHRPHAEHSAVPLASIPVGDGTFRAAQPRSAVAHSAASVFGRQLFFGDPADPARTLFAIDADQNTHWRYISATDYQVYGTSGMAPFEFQPAWNSDGQPLTIHVAPSPSNTAPSGHPRARVVRNVMETLAIAYALSGHDSMVLDYCGSGRVDNPRVHVSLPPFGNRDTTRKQTDRRFRHLSTCQHREVCDCHPFAVVVCIDTIYYMSVETVIKLIESCSGRRLVSLHHRTTFPTDTEISFASVGTGETVCSVPEVDRKTTSYRHSTFWDTTSPQLSCRVLTYAGSHAICEYTINDEYQPPPPPPQLLPPPSPVSPSASAASIAIEPEDRPLFCDDHSSSSVQPVSSDQYGWQVTRCEFPRHAHVFGSRYVIRDQGDKIVVDLPLPTRFIDTAAAFPVSTDASTSYPSYTAKCRSKFMAELQSYADTLGHTFPIEAVFIQVVTRGYERAIAAAASASALQRTAGFYAHVNKDEIVEPPRSSWRAYMLGLVAPLITFDVGAAARQLLAKIPPPCYVLAAFGFRQYLTTPSAVPARFGREHQRETPPQDSGPFTIQALGLALLMAGSTALSYGLGFFRRRNPVPPRRSDVISGVSDKPSLMHAEVHSFAACDSAQASIIDFPLLKERNGGRKAVIIREEDERKCDSDASEPMRFRSVGPTFAVGHSYGGGQHNVLVAINRRCEAACLTYNPTCVVALTKMMLLFGKACPSAGDDFKIKSFEEWSETSHYSRAKINILRAARAQVDLDPDLPLSKLECSSFIKKEIVFSKLDRTMSEAEPVGSPDGKPRIVSSLDPTFQVVVGPSIASLSDAFADYFSLACPVAMYLKTTNQQVGAWLRRSEIVCSPFFLEGDASNFDFSQVASIRTAVVAVYRKIGLPHAATDLLDIFAKSKYYRFRQANVSIKTTGTNASGANDTTISNNIVNLCTIVCCVANCLPATLQSEFVDRFVDSIGKSFDEVGRPAICAVVGGDDNMFTVAPEYMEYLTAEKLSLFSSNVGIKYNFIRRPDALSTTFVSSVFMPARMRRDIHDHLGRCILSVADSGADTYVLIPTPGRILQRLSWTTVPASTISDADLPRHLGEKAFGILSMIGVYVPLLTDYLQLIVAKYHDSSYNSDLGNEFHRSMRYGLRADPNPCLVDDDLSHDLAWEWFYERYGLSEPHVAAFLSVIADRLRPDTTQTTWHLPHEVANLMFSVDCA